MRDSPRRACPRPDADLGVYRLVIYPEVSDQIAALALPSHLLFAYADAANSVASSPWDGMSHHKDNPDAEVRRWLFGPLGAGQILYLVLEDIREVHVLLVQWVG